MNSTSLHNACCRGDLSVIKSLLDKGADINSKDGVGLSPLHHAVDLTLLCRWFNKNGADRTTVFNFIIDISECMTRMLIARGASINLKDIKGRTPLHIAAAEKNNKALGILIESGTDLDVTDDKGKIALHYCAEVGNLEGAKMLINKGCNVNSLDLNGNTPLHLSVDELHFDVCQLLLQNKSSINAVNKWLLTPFLMAAGCKDTSIVKLLLENGADANAVDSHGQTALHAAVESENINVLKLILNNLIKPDVNWRDCSGETALNIAVMLNNCNIIKLLQLHDANIDCIDNTGETPIHNVIIQLYDSEYPDMDFNTYYGSRLKTICTLLDYHADLTVPTRYKSALDIITGSDLFPLVKKAVLEYICKIKVAHLPAGKRYPDSLLLSVDPSFHHRCEKEVEMMKSVKIANASYYQILQVPITKLVFYLRNNEIEESLSQGSYNQFVIYSSFIEARFSVAAHRNNLLKASSPFFTSLVNVKPLLTYDCVEYVLSFLSNKDLQLLAHCINN